MRPSAPLRVPWDSNPFLEQFDDIAEKKPKTAYPEQIQNGYDRCNFSHDDRFQDFIAFDTIEANGSYIGRRATREHPKAELFGGSM